MPLLENPRHEAFAQALFEGLGTGRTHGQSYSAAGYTSNPSAAKVNASRLLKSAKHIIERVQELQGLAARHKRVTVESIVDELEGARQIARDNNQASAMVAASTAKAKILGLEISRTEVGRPGDFDAINSKENLAEKYLLEANPDATITASKREMVIAEIERHTGAISAIAESSDCAQQ
jgi:phage terminase small subunit